MEALIVHYNTPLLTKATVASVRKFSPDFRVTIFDNSGNYNGDADFILRNHIDFDKFINSYPNRVNSPNNHGSAKHCYSVDYCFKFFPEGFVLLDSDILLKRDISELYDDNAVWVGETEPRTVKKLNIVIHRVKPYCCYINTRMCRENGIRYFNGEKMWKLNAHPIFRWYDTGAWFHEACIGLPHREVTLDEYIEHYGSASFVKDKTESPEAWLERHQHLYL